MMLNKIFTSTFIAFFIYANIIACKNADNQKSNCTIHDIKKVTTESFADGIKGCSSTDSYYATAVYSLIDDQEYDKAQSLLRYYPLTNSNKHIHSALTSFIKGNEHTLKEKDSAYYYLNQAFKEFTKANDTLGIARSLLGLGIYYSNTANYTDAIQSRLSAMKYFLHINDSNHYYVVYTDLATNYYNIKEYANTINIVEKCVEYFKRHGNTFMIGYIYSILSTTYYKMEDYQNAIQYAKMSLAIRQTMPYKYEIGESYNNLALSYIATKKWDTAIDYLQQSIKLMSASNDLSQIPVVKINLAKCYYNIGKADLSRLLIFQVLSEAKGKHSLQNVVNCYKSLSIFYETQHQYDSALYYNRLLMTAEDSLLNIRKTKIIKELIIKYKTQENEQIINELSYKNKLSNTHLTLFISITILLIIIVVLTTYVLSKKNENSKLLLKQANIEIEHNKKHLENYTDKISVKNKLIEELELKLTKVYDETQTSDKKDIFSELYQFKILTEDHWREFKLLFDKAHPGFIRTLRSIHPSVTAAEERQSLLIKLSIGNKEAADMLGISIDSVKKLRYRLKKKFNLGENEILDDYVKSL